ncbi:MAG: PspA/IM30 family protein [Marinovum sp.]|nr:PspA/IM30 family protein [Marinovum sp.]
MFATLRTLVTGASARADEQVRSIYAIELIDQKLREATDAHKAARVTLAWLIQQRRGQATQLETLSKRILDLMVRAKEALSKDRMDLAEEAARAIAQMENEAQTRQTTLDRLETRILQLHQTTEASHRRMVDLKQNAVTARAIRKEQGMQTRLNQIGSGDNAMAEAEELIAEVMGQDDPFEKAQILAEIDQELSYSGLADRMAEAGVGASNKSTAADILARLKS